MAETKQMTDEQVENWRNILLPQFGPWALLMPKEDIQRMRDKMQSFLNETYPEE